MTLKRAFFLTAIWTFGMAGICGLVIAHFASHPTLDVSPEDRASQVGTWLGVAASIGYGLIWIPYAAKVGQQRRAERSAQRQAERKAQKRRKKSKRKR